MVHSGTASFSKMLTLEALNRQIERRYEVLPQNFKAFTLDERFLHLHQALRSARRKTVGPMPKNIVWDNLRYLNYGDDTLKEEAEKIGEEDRFYFKFFTDKDLKNCILGMGLLVPYGWYSRSWGSKLG